MTVTRPNPSEVERVARAIADNDPRCLGWEITVMKHEYRKLARAAIRALRPSRDTKPKDCRAVIHCGPGHQTTMRCELKGPHRQHAAGRMCFYEFYWTGK